jgi:hypothetical protein
MSAQSKRNPQHLKVVPALPHPVGDSEVYNLMRRPETNAERIKRLQLEARMLAKEQVEALEKALHAVSRQAEEIAMGGDAYPVGARELCRSLIEELSAKAMTLGAISQRV